MGFAVVKRAENLYGLPACLNGLEPAPSPDYPRVGPLHHENHGVFSHGPPGFSSGYILGITGTTLLIWSSHSASSVGMSCDWVGPVPIAGGCKFRT